MARLAVWIAALAIGVSWASAARPQDMTLTSTKPHRYQITVFAVDVDKLPFARNSGASGASVGFDLHFHAVAKATLTGLYGR